MENLELEKKKSTRKYKQIKEISDVKWNIGRDFILRRYTAKLPTYKKEIKKSEQ